MKIEKNYIFTRKYHRKIDYKIHEVRGYRDKECCVTREGKVRRLRLQPLGQDGVRYYCCQVDPGIACFFLYLLNVYLLELRGLGFAIPGSRTIFTDFRIPRSQNTKISNGNFFSIKTENSPNSRQSAHDENQKGSSQN
uniref:Uncharacterized protein n=1 Tax=Lygus hesperus TaxID=30085 RepID=A0A146LGK6_LYGHE